ncbi:MAG: hypothetical protein M1816_002764 [Peltula sp. TS41687]|nr:MAG: hypothetical protein M1816_002764 [Peltula sp. TS41687]
MPAHISSLEAITSSVPPKTDNVTYLTILESHLTEELLPTLLHILQDKELTANIGWDLIGILTPLLPASKACLEEIARSGNPREVILKVTEALRQIGFKNEQHEDLDDQSELDNGRMDDDKKNGHVDGSATSGDVDEQVQDKNDTLCKPVLEFTTLLDMISVIHPRIKAKYPSRFLCSTLKAVLHTYRDAAHFLSPSQVNEVTFSVVDLVKSLSGTERPFLSPPRPSTPPVQVAPEVAPDPEAYEEDAPKDDTAIGKRLLQSFVTMITEEFFSSLPSADDVSGLAWAARLQEHAHPEKTVPGRTTFSQLFTDMPQLKDRDSVVRWLLAATCAVDIDRRELIDSTSEPDDTTEIVEYRGHPESADDIPLSPVGSLFLLVQEATYLSFCGLPSSLHFRIFPDHEKVLLSFLDCNQADGLDRLEGEAEPIVDAVLALGIWAFEEKGGPNIDPSLIHDFNKYLQTLCYLSVKHPSPTLRFHAHSLCSSILHAHPTGAVRLAFIHDTLAHCPFEALKSSAVGWVKDEILLANRNRVVYYGEDGVFKQPALLTTLSPYLFPDLRDLFQNTSIEYDWIVFQLNLPFYLASLNLYYLLLSAPDLRSSLEIDKLHSDYQVQTLFLTPLAQASKRFQQEQTIEPLEAGESDPEVHADMSGLQILDDRLDRVTAAIGRT